MPCGATGVASTTARRAEGADDLQGGDCGRPGGDPVVHDDCRLAGEIEPGAIATEPPRPALELGALGRFDGGELFGTGADGPDDLVVEDADTTLADRPHSQLLVSRRAELAHDDHVEWSAERRGDLGGNRHATTREAEHHDVVGAQVVERRRQPSPGVDAIGEPHEAIQLCAAGASDGASAERLRVLRGRRTLNTR